MARGTVLIVDSDSGLNQVVGAFLNLQGFRINATGRLRDAVTKLALQKYAFVLLDPDLGTERGEELIRAVSDPAGLNTKTPLILITSELKYEIPSSMVTRINAILPKPFTFEDLQTAMTLA